MGKNEKELWSTLQKSRKNNYFGVSQVAPVVKTHLPVHETWETRVWSLGQEDPLEKEMATRSSILAWRIPWTEEPGGLHSPWSCRELDTTKATYRYANRDKNFFNYLCLGYITFSSYTHTHTHTHTGPLILLQSHILLSCYLNASRVCHLSPVTDHKFQKEHSIMQQKHTGFRFPDIWVYSSSAIYQV